MVNIEELVQINKKYGGSLINRNNLDFDLDMANHEKNLFKSNAYLLRGIINGHPFLDGNKRTATEIILTRFRNEGVKCDEEKLVKGIILVAKKNIHSINQLERRLRRWCIKR